MNYAEHDVSVDRNGAEEMVILTGQMGVPVIVVDGQAVIGFDRGRLQRLLDSAGKQRRPRLGLKVTDAGNTVRKAGEPPLLGALVGAVAPASGGERTGLRAGDIITSLNVKRINNIDELEEVLGSLTDSSRIPVTFYREDQAMKSEIMV